MEILEIYKMKCKKCKKQMKVDVESERYICECGFEIKWMQDEDLRKQHGY